MTIVQFDKLWYSQGYGVGCIVDFPMNRIEPQGDGLGSVEEKKGAGELTSDSHSSIVEITNQYFQLRDVQQPYLFSF